jgi:kynurenine formamidase
MQIRSFIVAYALVLAILLFADRRPGSAQQDRYSHVVDLTEGQNPPTLQASATESRTHIIAPGALIPGTWNAGQIPPERLIAPLVVIDVNAKPESQISLDDISTWESHHGMIPQGSVVAIRRGDTPRDIASTPLPITHDAAQFLIDARYTIGFAVETHVDFSSDRTLARQIALRGAYVVEQAAPFTSLPATGSLVIVAPTKAAPRKTQGPGDAPVRILAMVH